MFVNKRQLFCHIHISVQINVAVGRMIIGLMKLQKFLIGKLRNMIRITAGFTAIGGIRKQRIHDFSFQNFIRRGKSSFHFIVDNSVIFQGALHVFKLIAPALLAENLFFFVNIRIENSVQIHMHQILEVLIVAACNRIAGLVRIGHCIEKCVKRALYQLHKRIF